MHRLALEIRFADNDRAIETFDVFPPDGLDYVESWMRRRVGSSHFILVELSDRVKEADFRQLCRDFPGVIDVRDISEGECRRRCRGGSTG